MVRSGDVVIVNFAGATLTKGRPMVVVSSAAYHRQRPDAILGVLTSNVGAATADSDYVLQDWQQIGLHKSSAFRAYLGMETQADLRVIGHLSDRDWLGVAAAVRNAFG